MIVRALCFSLMLLVPFVFAQSPLPVTGKVSHMTFGIHEVRLPFRGYALEVRDCAIHFAMKYSGLSREEAEGSWLQAEQDMAGYGEPACYFLPRDAETSFAAVAQGLEASGFALLGEGADQGVRYQAWAAPHEGGTLTIRFEPEAEGVVLVVSFMYF